MPLSKEKIQELLAKKSKPRGGGGGQSKRTIDPNDRSYQAWFSMNHMLLDHDTNEMTRCENPNCQDPRPKEYGQTVVEVNGQKMCRYCFVQGWLLKNPAQATLEETG
jgi:hypothetical protein